MELDLPSVRGNWVIPSSAFVLAYYGVFCSAILAWPVTIVYAVSVLLAQTFRQDCVWLASFIFGGTTRLV